MRIVFWAVTGLMWWHEAGNHSQEVLIISGSIILFLGADQYDRSEVRGQTECPGCELAATPPDASSPV